jgi:sulfate adenylyltransferase
MLIMTNTTVQAPKRLPHGGILVDRIVSKKRAAEIRDKSVDYRSLTLSLRQMCDLELLLNGGFSPLTTFMGKADYESVVHNLRLADGTLWPMPIVLDVAKEFGETLTTGEVVALRDPEGTMLATLKVSEVYSADRETESRLVYRTTDTAHPGVDYLMRQTHPLYISGRLEGLQLPKHHDFSDMRRTPTEVRQYIQDRGWTKLVAFQTRNPMHRAHVEVTKRAAAQAEASLLIQPVVGMTKPGDIDHFTRVRIYKALASKYPADTTLISLLPLAMRMAGPREAVWHAIIRKNFGATHFIVGRDHAGPGKDSRGQDFYEPFEAHALAEKYASELDMTIMPGGMMVYVPSLEAYMTEDQVPKGTETWNISGTKLRELLRDGRDLPEWFTYPEVARELRRTHAPRSSQGIAIFLTGLSGAGKSTIAGILQTKLLELGGRGVTLLDGDIVRQTLSHGLGFSQEDRDANIRRIGYVASEIVRHGGIALCAPIAPYDATRKDVRQMVHEAGGRYVLAYVSTPLNVCENRDSKGLYKKARAGLIESFTGVSDPYEVPTDAELVLDTTAHTAGVLAKQVMSFLQSEGYV